MDYHLLTLYWPVSFFPTFEFKFPRLKNTMFSYLSGEPAFSVELQKTMICGRAVSGKKITVLLITILYKQQGILQFGSPDDNWLERNYAFEWIDIPAIRCCDVGVHTATFIS